MLILVRKEPTNLISVVNYASHNVKLVSNQIFVHLVLRDITCNWIKHVQNNAILMKPYKTILAFVRQDLHWISRMIKRYAVNARKIVKFAKEFKLV